MYHSGSLRNLCIVAACDRCYVASLPAFLAAQCLLEPCHHPIYYYFLPHNLQHLSYSVSYDEAPPRKRQDNSLIRWFIAWHFCSSIVFHLVDPIAVACKCHAGAVSNVWWIYFKMYWRQQIHIKLKTEACANCTEDDNDINHEGSDTKVLAQTNVPVTTNFRNQTQI